MGMPGIPELLIVLVIVVLIFGPKRLKSLGSDLGSAIKGFRKAVTDEDKKKAEMAADPNVIQGEVDRDAADVSAGTADTSAGTADVSTGTVDSQVKQNSNV
jgi:sec-independent protein translocase protein TatA